MKRKVFGGIICLILLISALFCAPTALAEGEYDIVRIKLSIGTPTQMPVLIDGNYTLAEDETLSLPRQLYKVKLVSGELRLYYDDDLLYSGDTITFIAHEPTEGLNNFIFMDNEEHGHRGYLGDMHFSIYSDYLRAINHIYLEEYLYGVVPHEMSNSWPIEALKAQAITARTYAVRHMGGGTYDLIDTSANQVYKGYDLTNTNAFAAVDGTSKQVLMSDGSYVATYYAASNGGQVDITQHIWSTGTTVRPYHVIQLDPFDAANPYSSQEALVFPKTVTQQDPILYQYSSSGTMKTGTGDNAGNAELYLKISSLSAVAAQGFIAGVSDDVEIVGINNITPHTHEGNHGLVNDYTGTNPCICFELADINMTVLASHYVETPALDYLLGDINGDDDITITDYTLIRLHILGLNSLEGDSLASADVNGDGEITISDYTIVRLHILNLQEIEQPPAENELVTDEVTVEFTIDMHEFDQDDGPYEAFTRSLRLFVVEETDTGFTIFHRRYGHGIGMSQRGAQQRANSGHTGEQIIQFYYPNTTIEPLAISKPPLSAITPAPDDNNATVVGTTRLNVRSTPDTNHDAIGKLPRGARVEILEVNAASGWHKINYGGTQAYVYASYILLDE